MEAIELELSLKQLDTLADKEYHESLVAIATRPGDSDELRLLRIGRLLGVVLKQPFAVSKDLDVPSHYTGAYRAWTLKPEADFEDPQTQSCWQYQALEAFRLDPEVIRSLGGELPSVYNLAEIAQGERGFFWYLATSCREYLCRDPKLRSQIKREVEKAKTSGFVLKNVTPEIIVASGGLTIGAMLVQAVPTLGMMGAPVIAGLVFIIYSIGIDAFCRWASDHELYHAEFPNADKDA